jgi:hypothetical protein
MVRVISRTGLPAGGQCLALGASAWRVAVEVQHPRGLVAFAAPRRPPRSGRWRQLGRGQPGRQHGARVADPGGIGPGELGQSGRCPARSQRAGDGRGEPAALAGGQLPPRAQGGEPREELPSLCCHPHGWQLAGRFVARGRRGGSLVVLWWIG